MEQFVLKAEPRTELGSRAAKRLREGGRVPLNLYGHGEGNSFLVLDRVELTRFLNAGHKIATIRTDSKDEPGVVKEVQYDPLGSTVIHVDFTRIRIDERIQVAVAVETVGVPKGVTAGGVIAFPMKDVLVSGLPLDIPERITVNIESLEIGHAIRLKDLKVPAGCAFVAGPEAVILTVVHHKVEVAAAPAEAAPTQPEVIGRKEGEEEEPEAPAEGEGKKKEKEKEKEKEKGKDKDKEK
ncbi:MAG: 50S ribosomal protein L25 [Planctomycetes bacterium]|nr:50S ribosomal protein L25 [Planctomycetota bacterium]